MFDDELLKGKKALVTGGGTGLGKSIGRRYLQLQADLVICGRRLDVLEATAEELRRETGGRVFVHACDVRDAAAVERMMDEIWQTGPLDILVNNAAGNFIARTEQLSHRAFEAIVGIVLYGAANCMREVGRRWIGAGRRGTILSISATNAFTGQAYAVPLAAAKAGVVAMTKSLAVEWGQYGIRLMTVAPGLFPTEKAWENLFPGADRDAQEREIPLRRYGEHVELANLCAYLASDGCGYITGENIVIDGGQWMANAGGQSMQALQGWTDEQWAALRKR